MKNTIKKLALLGCIGLVVSTNTHTKEGKNPLIQGTAWATASTACAALGVGASRVALFKRFGAHHHNPLSLSPPRHFLSGRIALQKLEKNLEKRH